MLHLKLMKIMKNKRLTILLKDLTSHTIHFFHFSMRKTTVATLLSAGLIYLLCSSPAVASEVDSFQVKDKKIHWYQTKAFKFGAAPVLLIGLGISELNNSGALSNNGFRSEIQKNFPGVETRIDDLLPSMPAVLAGGLYLSGMKGRNTPVNAAVMFFTANALSGFIGDHLKEATHVLRPNGLDFLSFPSNHTIAAFMAAEFLHQEYKDESPWISLAGYTMASTVGSIRMLENRHWLSDVLAGAGIGILSTKVTYVVYPLLYNMVFKNSKKKAQGFSFVPAAIHGKPGGTLSYRF
jgi:membrane-associated phospholipid phosphatase